MKTVRLGELIEISDLRNTDNKLFLEDVRGVSIEKKFIPTKANMDGVPLHNYKVVKPTWFCYVTVTSRNGGKISLAYQNLKENIIVSSSYEVFYVKDTNKLLPEYLFMLFNRSEFDRYSRFNSWGSARETFDFSELCLVEIPLPDLETQKQIVASYNGLRNVIDDNIALVEPLEKLCHAYIVDLKKKYPSVELKDFIEEVNNRNTDEKIHGDKLYGVSCEGKFIPSIAKQVDLDLSKYKLVHKYEFSYTLRIIIGSIAMYTEENPCIVSTSYYVFKVRDDKQKELLPEFLNMCYRRKEFFRYAEINSWGSAKDDFSFDEMCHVKIPLPPIEVQQSIVNIYNCAQEAKKIANEAKEELKKLCPALVQFAAKSA